MTTITVTTAIVAPVDRVFEAFTDIEHSAGRVSNIKAIEMLTTDRMRLGSRWLETREILGQLDTAEMEVTAFEHQRTYTITHHKAGGRIDAVFTFEPIEDHGTRVRVDYSLQAHGLPPGAVVPLRWAIAGKVRDVLGADLADLRAYIERRLVAARTGS